MKENIAETLARELKKPIVLPAAATFASRIAAPAGWDVKLWDDERLQDNPRRKKGSVVCGDAESFLAYIAQHGDPGVSSIWCDFNAVSGAVSFVAILNDHQDAETGIAGWRDHTAKFVPQKSEEWKRWITGTESKFTQAEFAEFIEENRGDIVSGEGLPSGAQMLDMALNFEAKQDMRFKSAIRLQSGGLQMAFTQDDDAQTVERMQMFDRFQIGIPVFRNGDPYAIEARLRYRVPSGKLSFTFALIRADKVVEAETKTLVEHIRNQAGVCFYMGTPGI